MKYQTPLSGTHWEIPMEYPCDFSWAVYAFRTSVGKGCELILKRSMGNENGRKRTYRISRSTRGILRGLCMHLEQAWKDAS